MAEPFWWLSFADPARPLGDQFLGAIIGQGYTLQAVITETHLREINPGGHCECSFADIPAEHVPPERFRWRLLSYDELEASGLLSPMKCRQCETKDATVAIRSGLEWHPECDDCAAYWAPHRHGPLSNIASDYTYPEDE